MCYCIRLIQKVHGLELIENHGPLSNQTDDLKKVLCVMLGRGKNTLAPACKMRASDKTRLQIAKSSEQVSISVYLLTVS